MKIFLTIEYFYTKKKIASGWNFKDMPIDQKSKKRLFGNFKHLMKKNYKNDS